MANCENPCAGCQLADYDPELRACVGPVVDAIREGRGGQGKYTRELAAVATEAVVAIGREPDSLLLARLQLAGRMKTTYGTCTEE